MSTARWSAVLAAGMVLILAGTPADARSGSPKRDVPFVPTPEPVVARMIDLLEIRRGDVLYDLGCGDGRIVVEAARRHGIRGVGVDIDPTRIAESRVNARLAGVVDRVRFLEADLFRVPFSEATVMTLYLLPDVNLRLRPRILDELRPGTRVVSHDFDMGDWKPDQTERVSANGREHTIYRWVVPAKAAGTWRGTDAMLELEQAYQQVTGTIQVGNTRVNVTGRLVGDALTLAGSSPTAGQLTFDGRVGAAGLRGRVRTSDGKEREIAAQRPAEPASITAP